MPLRLVIISLVLLVTVPGGVAEAKALPMPSGAVILTVQGDISKHNQGKTALLSMKMLRQFKVVNYATKSPWLSARARFTGVLLRDVLNYVGARKGSDIKAVALDDYEATIPWSDVERYDVLLAFKVNGVTLKRRDKGPLWIVYPQDEHTELEAAEVADRWVWQLETLEIK